MLKQKKKICSECGNESYIFSKGRCKTCASKTYKKISKISDKGIVKKELKRELLLEDLKFYNEIWNSRPRICFETGKPLGNELNICYFHHVLPKALYPQFRHSDFNIVLLDISIHNQVETNLSKCPKVLQLTQELKEKYVNNRSI